MDNNNTHGILIYLQLVTISLLFHFSIVYAADYYVAPNGNDSNPGTISQPWQHIAYATCGGAFLCPIATSNPNMIKAGDILYLRRGTYTESLIRVASSGTSTNPITIMPYNSESVIMDAGFTTGTTITPIFYLDNTNWLIFDGSNSTTLKRGLRAIFRLGENSGTTNVTIKNFEMQDIVVSDNSAHIYLDAGGNDNINILRNKIHGHQGGGTNVGSGIIMFRVGTLNILNNEIYDVNNGVIYKHSNDDGKITTFQNNIIHDINNEGMVWSRSDGVIKNNLWYNLGLNGYGGIRFYEEAATCDAIITERNQIIHNTLVNTKRGIVLNGPSTCTSNGARDSIVRDNLIYNFTDSSYRGLAVWIWNSPPDTSNTTFGHNFIYSTSYPSTIMNVVGSYYAVSNCPLSVCTYNKQQALMFRSYVANDFTLQPISPGIKAASDGTTVGARMSTVGTIAAPAAPGH